MSNQNQTQDSNRPQKDPSSTQSNPRINEPNTSRVGNNIEKDEPRSSQGGSMKKEAQGSAGNKPSQDNRPQDTRKSANS